MIIKCGYFNVSEDKTATYCGVNCPHILSGISLTECVDNVFLYAIMSLCHYMTVMMGVKL
jgi:hypothetical protein